MGCGVSKQQPDAATSSGAVGAVLDNISDAQVALSDATKDNTNVEASVLEKRSTERQETPVMHQVWVQWCGEAPRMFRCGEAPRMLQLHLRGARRGTAGHG